MSHSNLSLWKLSIYAAAISAAAAIIGPINPQAAVALPRIPGVPVPVEDCADIFVKSTVGGIKLNLPLATKLNGVVAGPPKIYEIGGKQANGQPYEIDVYATAKPPCNAKTQLDEVELTIPYAQVPLAARNLVAKKAPGCVPTLTEKSIRPVVTPKFNNTVVYEIECKNGTEVDVNPQGTYVVITAPTF